MAITPSDIGLTKQEFHAFDINSKEGGYHTSILITSDVDSCFLPGIIDGSDSSEEYRDQYRKVSIKNLGEQSLYRCKVYGFNTKRNNIVKMALEKNLEQIPILDGSETIKDYLTPPSLFGRYAWTECDSDDSMDIGNEGIIPVGSAQGVWLRMRCLKNISDDTLDTFRIGLKYTETP